jgi:SAM-dependent methyltransferase
MDKKAQTIATYNATAPAMAEKFRDSGPRTEDINKGFSFIKENNPKVLEIGCGNGRDAKEILKHTSDYIGVDISKEMTRLAREYTPEGRFEVGDIENYNFPVGLDLIFSFASLLHSNKENVKEILRKTHDSLNVGGVFYISLKHDEYHEESKADEFGMRTFYFYTPELIKELAGNQYHTIFEDVHELRGQKWFKIALQKA